MKFLTFSGDDYPVMNAYINPDCLNEFYRRVISLHYDYEDFTAGEFLTRSYIFSGKYLTFAGALMFGNIIRVRASLVYDGKEIVIESQNIWEAYRDLLPRLINKLSLKCRKIYTQAFVNALLNSDYGIDNKINITIKSRPPQAVIDYPGIINEVNKNHRLQKIFALSGISRGIDFNNKDSIGLESDSQNFRVRAKIRLEGIAELPKPVIL